MVEAFQRRVTLHSLCCLAINTGYTLDTDPSDFHFFIAANTTRLYANSQKDANSRRRDDLQFCMKRKKKKKEQEQEKKEKEKKDKEKKTITYDL